MQEYVVGKLDDIPDGKSKPALQVFAEDTGVALPGDRVVARIYPGRTGRRPGEKIGAVVRVLERERDTHARKDLHDGRGHGDARMVGRDDSFQVSSARW